MGGPIIVLFHMYNHYSLCEPGRLAQVVNGPTQVEVRFQKAGKHFTGLPIGVVLLHMLGSALLVAAATETWDRQVARYVTAGPGVPVEAAAPTRTVAAG